nr:hypothetical protein CTI12_AA509060 [Tanacetum cinerariifolium]
MEEGRIVFSYIVFSKLSKFTFQQALNLNVKGTKLYVEEVFYYLVRGKKEKREAAREQEAQNVKARANKKQSKQECVSCTLADIALNVLVGSSIPKSFIFFLYNVDVRGVDSDHVDSFEEGEIIGDSVLNNDGYVKGCMEKNLDDDVEKDIEDCSKNVTEKYGMVNNNMSNNVEGEILEDHFDGDHRNDTIKDNANVNPSTNVYLDVNQNTSIPEVVEDLSSLDRSSDKAE